MRISVFTVNLPFSFELDYAQTTQNVSRKKNVFMEEKSIFRLTFNPGLALIHIHAILL